MNLKEEFIKIANILLKDHPDLKIVEDYKNYYCSEEDSDIFINCRENNCEGCQYRNEEIYDIAIMRNFHADKYDEYILMNFQTIEDVYKEIENLNSKLSKLVKNKAIYEYENKLAKKIKINNLESFEEELDYYCKKEELYKYARKFQLKLAKDGFIALAMIDMNIHFVDGLNKENGGHFNAFDYVGFLKDLGYFQNPTIKILNIDMCTDHNINTFKQTIRHEIIHYALWLYDLPHYDDSPEFHALCKIYKAGAYEEVPEDKQEYCKELKQLSKDDLYRKLLGNYIDCFDENNNYINYHDMYANTRKRIKKICTNWDVEKIKHKII